MHDGLAHKYIADSDVVDVDDRSHPAPPRKRTPSAAPPISMPRVSTEDLEMNVLVADFWHRVMPDISQTACELEFHIGFTPIERRADKLMPPLCPVCFTPGEIARAAKRFRDANGFDWGQKK